MRRIVAGIGALAVVLALAARPDAAREGATTFSTPGAVATLAVDGNRVAAVTQLHGSCDRIVVWTAATRTFATFDTTVHCPNGFPFIWEVPGVALGAGRVAWIEAGGGNLLELLIRAAPISGGTARVYARASNSDGAAGDWSGRWLGQLVGGGSVIGWNSWEQCTNLQRDSGCADPLAVLSPQLRGILPSGRSALIRAGADSFRLRAVGGNRLAVEPMKTYKPDVLGGRGTSSGTIVLLSASGTTLARVDAAGLRGVALTPTKLIILRRRILEIRSAASGRLVKTIGLPAGAPEAFAGANDQVAVLGSGWTERRLSVVRLRDGRIEPITVTPGSLGAQVSNAGLFYAYNVETTRAKGRIVFVPTRDLLALFR
jgi:hypothetical protein